MLKNKNEKNSNNKNTCIYEVWQDDKDCEAPSNANRRTCIFSQRAQVNKGRGRNEWRKHQWAAGPQTNRAHMLSNLYVAFFSLHFISTAVESKQTQAEVRTSCFLSF